MTTDIKEDYNKIISALKVYSFDAKLWIFKLKVTWAKFLYLKLLNLPIKKDSKLWIFYSILTMLVCKPSKAFLKQIETKENQIKLMEEFKVGSTKTKTYRSEGSIPLE